jgi:two-component system phosphate regulon sensor histidine kinase PhoR
MTWRFLTLTFFLLAGALVGAVAGAEFNRWAVNDLQTLSSVALGGLVGGLLWFALDSWRLFAFLDWLKSGSLEPPALNAGLWGEIADRTRRRLRNLQTGLRESDQRLDDFLGAIQASPTGVILLDKDGRIEWFNQMSAQHFGLDIQRDLQQFFVNLARDPEVSRYFNAADFTSDIVVMGRASTPTRPVRLSVQVYPYGRGRQLLLSRDVTAVEQAETMRRDFVANVSHEIRTPLTVMAGFIETMQSLPLSQTEQNRYLALMGQQADRMQSLVNDLLVLSKLEGSPMPSPHAWCSLENLLNSVKQDATLLSEHLSGLTGQAHQLVFAPVPAVSVAGSMTEMLSALTNLMHNAVRYTPAGARVDLRAELLPDGRLSIAVSDSGMGIEPEHLPRLTERFYRVDRSRSRETGGTGLGLAIVKHVMQRHGGELRIESQLGKGSCFTLVFPANRVQAIQA